MKKIIYVLGGILLIISGILGFNYYQVSDIAEVAIQPVASVVTEPVVEPEVVEKPVAKPVVKQVVKVEPKVPEVKEPVKVVEQPTPKPIEKPVDNTLAKEVAKKDLDTHIAEWNKQIQVYRDRVIAIGEELRLLGIEFEQKRNEFNATSNPTDEQRKAYSDYLTYYSQKTNALGKERDTYPAKIAELQQYIDLAIADYEQKWGK